jgi:hypothetical protein
MGNNNVKKCTARKILFWIGLVRSTKEGKNYCTGTTSPTNQPRKDPLSFFLFQSPSPQFQQKRMNEWRKEGKRRQFLPILVKKRLESYLFHRCCGKTRFRCRLFQGLSPRWFDFLIRKDSSTSAVCIWQSIRQRQRNWPKGASQSTFVTWSILIHQWLIMVEMSQ